MNKPISARNWPHLLPRPAGFTLSELLACLVIAGILATAALPLMNRLVAEQRVVSATNSLLSLMRLARAEAMTGGPVLLCDNNYECSSFEPTQQLSLIRADSTPPHIKPRPDSSPLALLTLPGDVHVSWRRFRGDALVFHRSGILHFQNGHFLVCNRLAGRRIVMNWAGRPRVEHKDHNTPCPL